jgi:hypothetical protein
MREFLRLTVAGAVSITGRILWRRYAEQLTGSRDVLGAPTIGEESVVTDTVEPVGQHMDQEAADELVGAERHELVAGVELGPVIFPFEGHALAVEGDEPAVSNSDPPERSGPFRGQRLLRCGSSRDSPLEEGVTSEPVSESPKFPASWENTGNFIGSGLGDGSTVIKNAIESSAYEPIPYAS